MTILGKEITKERLRRIIAMAVIAVLALGALVYLGLIWHEKQQFNQAERKMDDLYSQIVQKIGKPDQEKKDKLCAYEAREIGRGPRSCLIDISFIYQGRNSSDSNRIMGLLSETFGLTFNDYLARKDMTKFPPYESLRADQIFSSSLHLSSSKDCVMRLTYPATLISTNEFKTPAKENLSVSITCSGDAMAEYYPVKD